MRVAAGSVEEISARHCTAVADDRAVVLRFDEEVVAFPNRCLHQDSPLAGGVVLDGVLICPLHFWRYQLPEGQLPSGLRLERYPVSIEDGEVFVELPDPEPARSIREVLLQHAREWKPQSQVKAVVWDMGGVFRRYFTEVMVDVGKREGWPLGRLPLGPTGLIPDPDYEAMAEGKLTEPEYLALLTSRLRELGIAYDPVTSPDWSREERPATWDAIARIADSSLRQLILTNDASLWMGERWWERWPPARYFDFIVDVATLGKRKPHPETYRVAIRQAGLPPHQFLFVDDMPVNCRGAEAVGMKSLFFDITEPERSIARLLERIGL